MVPCKALAPTSPLPVVLDEPRLVSVVRVVPIAVLVPHGEGSLSEGKFLGLSFNTAICKAWSAWVTNLSTTTRPAYSVLLPWEDSFDALI